MPDERESKRSNLVMLSLALVLVIAGIVLTFIR